MLKTLALAKKCFILYLCFKAFNLKENDMIKDYEDQYNKTGAWADRSWYKTLCNRCIIDDFGNLVVT